MSLIEVKNISFGYHKDENVITELSFEVEEGEFLAVIGPNGSGKTTLVNLMCKILNPDAGKVFIGGKNVKNYSFQEFARLASVVRQEMLPVYDYNVEEVVMMGRTPYFGAYGFEKEKDRELAREAMATTEILKFRERNLKELSGGERQRVFIARALAQDTSIMFLDEPTSFLDYKHQIEIFDLLKKMQLEKKKTIISVTHDINLATQYCQNVLMFDREGEHKTGSCEKVLTKENIRECFGVKAYCFRPGKENIFLPLGQYSKDFSLLEDNNGVKK